MPSEYSGSSTPTDALVEALQAAVEPMPEFLQATVTSNRMLYVLERAAPKLYAHWAEQLVDATDVDGPLARAGDRLRRMERPYDERDWSQLPPAVREIYGQDAEEVLRAALGLGGL